MSFLVAATLGLTVVGTGVLQDRPTEQVNPPLAFTSRDAVPAEITRITYDFTCEGLAYHFVFDAGSHTDRPRLVSLESAAALGSALQATEFERARAAVRELATLEHATMKCNAGGASIWIVGLPATEWNDLVSGQSRVRPQNTIVTLSFQGEHLLSTSH